MTTKILFCVTKGNWGGAQRYVYDLATTLPKSDFEVEVLSGSPGLLTERLLKAGVNCSVLPELSRDISLYKDFASLVAIYKIFKEKKPDLVHLNSSKMGALGGAAARLAKIKKVVFTAHGLPQAEVWRPFWERLLIFLGSYATALLADVTIATSKSDWAGLSAMPLVREKVRLIPIGMGGVVFFSREESRKKLGLSELSKTFELCTVAELHPNKNLSSAIKAVVAFNRNSKIQIRYTILGGGELKETLVSLVKTESPNGKIVLAGFVEDAVSHLKAFDGFLMPSVKEAVSYALLEAGLAGLRSAVTPIGGMLDVVKNGRNGIVSKSPRAEDIEKALKLLVNSKLKLGEKLRETVEKNFSLEVMRAKTTAVYQKELAVNSYLPTNSFSKSSR